MNLLTVAKKKLIPSTALVSGRRRFDHRTESTPFSPSINKKVNMRGLVKRWDLLQGSFIACSSVDLINWRLRAAVGGGETYKVCVCVSGGQELLTKLILLPSHVSWYHLKVRAGEGVSLGRCSLALLPYGISQGSRIVSFSLPPPVEEPFI